MIAKSVAALLLTSLFMMAPVSADGPRDYVDCVPDSMNMRDPTRTTIAIAQCVGDQLQECLLAPRTMDLRTPPEELERNLNGIERCMTEETGGILEISAVYVNYEANGWTMHLEAGTTLFQGMEVGATISPYGFEVYEKVGIHGCYVGVDYYYGPYQYCVY